MTSPPVRLAVWAPVGVGEVRPGDDLAVLVGQVLEGTGLVDGDVVVVTSKIVSKAENRVVVAQDREQAITDETVRVVASREHSGGVLRIVENRLGLVMAAAGVDASNTPEGTALLLPVDPDASARRLRAALQDRFGVRLAIVISDTAGRAWREGLTDIAIGAAGLQVLDDLRGGTDTHGRTLTVTVTAVADEVAAASELVRGKTAGRPVAVVRGLGRFVTQDDGPGARALVRPAEDDLFRLGTAEAWQEGFLAGRAERRGAVGADWGVVVPVKHLDRAKSRLDVSALPGAAAHRDVRQNLALAFAVDTVEAVVAARRVAAVVVVTSEPRVVDALSRYPQVRFVADQGNGLNGAVRAGVAALAAAHAGPGAVVLGDLPALRATDLDDVLAQAQMHARALVPDTDGSGTTLLTALDIGRLVPRFGPGSRAAHVAAGHHVLTVDGGATVRRDVDSADDLEAAVRLGVGPATAHVLARLARDAGARVRAQGPS